MKREWNIEERERERNTREKIRYSKVLPLQMKRGKEWKCPVTFSLWETDWKSCDYEILVLWATQWIPLSLSVCLYFFLFLSSPLALFLFLCFLNFLSWNGNEIWVSNYDYSFLLFFFFIGSFLIMQTVDLMDTSSRSWILIFFLFQKESFCLSYCI